MGAGQALIAARYAATATRSSSSWGTGKRVTVVLTLQRAAHPGGAHGAAGHRSFDTFAT
jgi:hypothetical protein